MYARNDPRWWHLNSFGRPLFYSLTSPKSSNISQRTNTKIKFSFLQKLNITLWCGNTASCGRMFARETGVSADPSKSADRLIPESTEYIVDPKIGFGEEPLAHTCLDTILTLSWDFVLCLLVNLWLINWLINLWQSVISDWIKLHKSWRSWNRTLELHSPPCDLKVVWVSDLNYNEFETVCYFKQL